MQDCPDPEGNPDDCDLCHGWGHKCWEWVQSHEDQVAIVRAAYEAGYDPTRFYPSVQAARASEAITAKRRTEN